MELSQGCDGSHVRNNSMDKWTVQLPFMANVTDQSIYTNLQEFAQVLG